MSSADSSGILRCRICFLDIQVSKAALGRALIIMDSIIKAMELQGGQVVSDDDNKTLVHMDGVDICFGIEEEVDLLEDDIGFRDFPSGRLLLTMHEYHDYSTHRFQKNWRDTKSKKLEDKLNGFLKGLTKLVTHKRACQKEQEELQRQLEEERRVAEELKRQQEEHRQQVETERQNVDSLIADAENSYKSKLVREFVSAVEQQHLSATIVYEPAMDFAAWKKWAYEQADRLDPLVSNPSSILDGEDECGGK